MRENEPRKDEKQRNAVIETHRGERNFETSRVMSENKPRCKKAEARQGWQVFGQ
jgi:hypothetical protein